MTPTARTNLGDEAIQAPFPSEAQRGAPGADMALLPAMICSSMRSRATAPTAWAS
jgi:hypothetical protein